MAKHQIFVVHGMGHFEPGWSEVLQRQIVDCFDRFPRAKGFAADIEFKEINYNQVFEAWRKQWREDAQGAASALAAEGLGQGIAAKLVDLAGKPAGDGFLRTHVLDVIAYRFLLPVAEECGAACRSRSPGTSRACRRATHCTPA